MTSSSKAPTFPPCVHICLQLQGQPQRQGPGLTYFCTPGSREVVCTGGLRNVGERRRQWVQNSELHFKSRFLQTLKGNPEKANP